MQAFTFNLLPRLGALFFGFLISSTAFAISTVEIQVVTQTSAAGPFQFTAPNLTPNQLSVSTTLADVAQPDVPTQLIVNGNTPTLMNITKSGTAANFELANVACEDKANIISNTDPVVADDKNSFYLPFALMSSDNVRLLCILTYESQPVITVEVQAKTVDGVGGPFEFSPVNLAATPASVTTDAAGVPKKSATGPIAVTDTAFVTFTTNDVAQGSGMVYRMIDGYCTDENSAVTGNPSIFGVADVEYLDLVIPSQYLVDKAKILCTFIYSSQSVGSTVEVQAVSLGGAAGPFSFSPYNLDGPIADITTDASGVPKKSASGPQKWGNLPFVTFVTDDVVVNPQLSYKLISASCIDENSAITGNVGAFGISEVEYHELTIPAQYLVERAKILCTFTYFSPFAAQPISAIPSLNGWALLVLALLVLGVMYRNRVVSLK